MIALTKTFTKKVVIESLQFEKIDLSSSKRAYFLQEVIESLECGVLILTEVGEVVYANATAYRLCCQLNQNKFEPKFLPPVIWHLCESLLARQSRFSDLIIISDEIVLDKSSIFRIRVRLVKLEAFKATCLLVTIENKYESLKSVALTEVRKFDLTPREAEIWFLYRSNHSYKEIASQLCITLNTVKKHMKNIHAKRQAFLC
ncbi:MAG: helix-turn-helix transcriptional regulator [Desmonostoc vinosum HA7617-LM4]|jgi:DNA-binding CsgD family transcriptional regulator|nr:helix-turn-helix transcriptional regulator [Desmonostoc vinosum HA7617-LM4]